MVNFQFKRIVHLSLLALFILPGLCQAKFAGGDGKKETPWQITNWTELNEVRTYTYDHKCFLLMNDLDLMTDGYTTLIKNNGTLCNGGKGWDPIFSFQGTFDGGGHSIGDLRINQPNYTDCGLFGKLNDSISVIKNLCIKRSTVVGNGRVGGIVGDSYGTIFNASFSGVVYGNSCVGGIVGYNADGEISCCFSTGDIKGVLTASQSIGGLVGYNSKNGNVSNCYSTSSVNAYATLGGLIGYNFGIVEFCYSTGNVSGTTVIGELIGYHSSSGKYQSCFCLGASGDCVGSLEAAPDGITGKKSSELADKSTFIDWNFSSIWDIKTGEYPSLRVDLNNQTEIISKHIESKRPPTLSASISGRLIRVSKFFPFRTPFSLFDLSGQQVIGGLVNGNIIDAGILPGRVYVLRITTSDVVQYIKVMAR
jgi:hypothetical protein